MKNLKVHTKLVIGFMVVALFTLIVGIMSLLSMNSLATDSNVIHQYGVNISYAGAVNRNILTQQEEYNNLFFYKNFYPDDPEVIERSEAHLAQLADEMTAYYMYLKQSLDADQALQLLERIRILYEEECQPAASALLLSIDQGEPLATMHSLSTLKDKYAQVLHGTEELNEYLITSMESAHLQDLRLTRAMRIFQIGFCFVALGAAIFMSSYIGKLIAKPVTRIAKAAKRIAVGDTQVDVALDREDELGELATAFTDMVAGIREQAETTEQLALGDYDLSLTVRSDKDIMSIAYNKMLDAGNALMTSIRSAALQVSAGADQIAHGAQSLASGTTQQASNIEEFSASLNLIREKTESNAEIARLAKEAALVAADRLDESLHAMGEMLSAMQAIDESSQAITKVIKVIDEIAFQTNILSLNAAVEAARAGQHGKGFAVVADEVRNLASKSAAAARETADLIEGSNQRVRQGNEMLHQTSGALKKVEENARIVVEKIEELAMSSREQAQSIQEMNQGMEQISSVVHANSAVAEQAAASAEEMSAQSDMLKRITEGFKLRTDNAPLTPSAEEPIFPQPEDPHVFHLPSSAFAMSDKY